MKRSARTSTVVKTRPAATGSVTLPAEAGEETMVVELAAKWGADAIRDSDGTNSPRTCSTWVWTSIPPSAWCAPTRVYPRQHLDHLPQKFLMSDPVTATGTSW